MAAFSHLRCPFLVLVTLAVSGGALAVAHPGHDHSDDESRDQPPADFVYDPADHSVGSTVLENAMWYDADVAVSDGAVWHAWLEFTSGKGDRVWVGRRENGGWVKRTLATEQFGSYARPTLTFDARGTMWLSYEAEHEQQWDVLLVRLDEQGRPAGDVRRVSPGAGADISHQVAADAEGLWFVWQSDAGGQFDILARRLAGGAWREPVLLSDNPNGDWRPQVAVAADGRVLVAWDAYDGDSYNVYLRSQQEGRWGPATAVAHSSAFEGRPALAVDRDDRVWIAWEQGGENWGKPYRGLLTPSIGDQLGPLHRFRELHVAVVERDGAVRRLKEQLPMPSLRAAQERDVPGDAVKRTGAFYERARLAVDGAGRVWLAYRHFYAPWLGVEHRSHIESGWGVYARCYADGGWSDLHRFDVGQGDGMQRLELAPSEEGVHAVWTTGRTDRRPNERPRGLVVASVASGKAAPAAPALAEPQSSVAAVSPAEPRRERPAVNVGGRRYQLFFGDLHRHTDLSLCRVPIDGTIDDAYRYASDVAGLDFLGVTDHSRDIALGDALSQLWWRSRKEVYRHQLGDSFLPFFAYERSHGDTADHNVISLRGDMLRPHTYPVPQFWRELDDDTITIPHQPIRRDTWKYQNDELRPLVEIYQGARDRSIEEDAHRGLDKGYRLGFIASSDHMSTSASYACVWAEEASRASIFQALKSRRTYGATAKIELAVRAGDHWMGEQIRGQALPPLELTAMGTAPVRSVTLVVDGKAEKVFSPDQREVRLRVPLELKGEHYVYFHLLQADGNQAWSSPIWLAP